MPEKEMMRAQNEAANCDLMVAVGSSLVVYPAATIPLLGKQSGAKFVILNNEPTDCLLYTSPSPRDKRQTRMPSSA